MNSTRELSCPICGVGGKRVKAITLRFLIHSEKVSEIGEKAYYFCGSPDCDTVYFAEDGSRIFSRADLTVRGGVKESSPPRPVCYCFGHSMEDIFNEVERTGKSTVAAEIRKRIAAGGCSCETKNPQGACCLGTVEDVIRAAYEQFDVAESVSKAKGEDKGCCGSGGCCK